MLTDKQLIVEQQKQSIKLLILERSMYILKNKFDLNKEIINKIYFDNKEGPENLCAIPLEKFVNVITRILDATNFLMIPFQNYNELITGDLLYDNKEKCLEIINLINKYVIENFKEYNKIFIDKKYKRKDININENKKDDNKNEDKKENNQEDIKSEEPKPEQQKNEEEKKNEEEEKEENQKKEEEKEKEENQKKEEEDKKEEKVEEDKQNEKEEKKDEEVKKEEDDKKENEEKPKEKEENKEEDISNKNLSKIEEQVKEDEYEQEISDDDKVILNSENLLYSETIPRILADFLQKNTGIGIITYTNDEMNKEIRNLYDNKILKNIEIIEKYDPIEEQNSILKQLLLDQLNIEKKTKIYENLLIENMKEGKNTYFISEMIQKLRYQQKVTQVKIDKIQNNNNVIINNTGNLNESLVSLNKKNNLINMSKISRSQKKIMNKEEIRKNAINEIFYFYCKQHNQIGSSNFTFDLMKENESNLDISEFNKFCVEFKISVKMSKLTEIYKKNVKNPQKMNIDEFKTVLPILAVEINNERKAYISNRIKLYQIKLNDIEEKEKKSEEKKIPQIEEEKKEGDQNINNNNDEFEEIPKEEKKENDNNEESKKEENENNNNEEIPKKENIENNNNEEKNETSQNDINQKNENKPIIENIPKNKIFSKKKNNSKLPIKASPSLLLENKEEIQEKISKLFDDLENLKKKTTLQLLEEFYSYLEIDNSHNYRKKMVGFLLPFSIHDKMRNEKSNYVIKNNNNTNLLKELYLKHQDKMEQEKKIIKERELNNRLKKKEKQKIEFEKKLKEKMSPKNYMDIYKKNQDYEKVHGNNNNLITWEILENADSSNFLLNSQQNVFTNAENEGNKIFKNNNNNNINNQHYQNESFIDSDDENLIYNLNKKNNLNNQRYNNNNQSQNAIDFSNINYSNEINNNIMVTNNYDNNTKLKNSKFNTNLNNNNKNFENLKTNQRKIFKSYNNNNNLINNYETENINNYKINKNKKNILITSPNKNNQRVFNSKTEIDDSLLTSKDIFKERKIKNIQERHLFENNYKNIQRNYIDTQAKTIQRINRSRKKNKI